MDAFSESLSTPRAAIDELAEALADRFGLVDAQAQAKRLRADPLLTEARALHGAALAGQRQAIDGNQTLHRIEQASAEFKRTRAQVEQIEAWRAVEIDQLALDLLVLAPNVAGAGDPDWRPSAPAGAAPSPIYVRSPRLRFADHFEPDIDLLIVDHELGTIGVIQWLEFDHRPVQDRVREHVERATYLRHLLVAEQGQGRQTFTVELVLVHPAAEPGQPGFEMLGAVGEQLRDLALDTDCLHAIGINLLPWQAGRAVAEPALRRAFSWLLRDARRWFAELATPADPSQADARLARIELDEYRLAGHRELALDSRTRLHLLHGHNGSGKSSLVEALELMLTGGIERLAGVDDYEEIIRNRYADDQDAGIRLVDRGGREYAFALAGAARPEPLAPGSRAASFRLDQTLMDRLARASEVDRAAELLAAFFAEEAAVRERWRAAVADSRRQVEQLPERLRRWLLARQRERQELHDTVIEQFVGLGEGRLRRELVDALLPLGLDSLVVLRGQLPALGLLDERLAIDGWIAIDDPIFTSLEFELGGLVGELEPHQQGLAAAGRALDRASRWWHDTQHPNTADDFAEAVDEWLELGALSELVEQQQAILTSLVGSRAQGWDDRRLDDAGPAAALLRTLAQTDPGLIEAMGRARARWERRRAELGAVLDRRLETEPRRAGDGPIAAARVRLDADEVAALDELGRWLASSHEQPPLGERVRQAIESESPSSFASWSIGPHEWALPLRAQLEQMRASLARLRDVAGESSSAMTLEAEAELAGLIGAPRDEDAPAAATLQRESIGELPITIVEEQHEPALDEEEADEDEQADEEGEAEPDAAKEIHPAMDPMAGDDDLLLGAPRGEPVGAPDEAPSTFERIAKTLLGKSRRSDDRSTSPGAAPMPSAAAPPMRSPSANASTPVPVQAAMRSKKPAPSIPQRGPVVQRAEPMPEPAPEPVPERASEDESAELIALSDSPPVMRTPEPSQRRAPEPSTKPSMRFELRAMLERLRLAHAASLEAQRVGAAVRESFVARLAAHDEGAMGLVDALNELMALFTPARWAYEDVLLRYEEDGDSPRLQFETGSYEAVSRARADLRLNTAQLNAFVLALFLLCAPRVSNPLGLLVLDDPLQNMDELTVTTLARGLAKLLRVLPERWTLMMLFHGEGDLARFHDEVECGVYLLPWLSPTQRGNESVIECRPQTSRLGLTIQRLVGFVALRP